MVKSDIKIKWKGAGGCESEKGFYITGTKSEFLFYKWSQPGEVFHVLPHGAPREAVGIGEKMHVLEHSQIFVKKPQPSDWPGNS